MRVTIAVQKYSIIHKRDGNMFYWLFTVTELINHQAEQLSVFAKRRERKWVERNEKNLSDHCTGADSNFENLAILIQYIVVAKVGANRSPRRVA